MFKYILTFILGVYCGLHLCHAQPGFNRVIATDYNECLTGVKDTLGNWIIPASYQEVRYAFGERFIARNNNIYSLLDSNGTEFFKVSAQYVEQTLLDDYYEVSDHGKVGIVDLHFDTIVPIKYNSVHVSLDTIFFAESTHRKWEIYRSDGTSIMSPWRSKLSPRVVGHRMYRIARAHKLRRNKYGLIDDSAHIVLPRKYDGIGNSSGSDLVFVQDGFRGGYLSQQGKFVWPVIYNCWSRVYSNHDMTEYWESEQIPENIFSNDSVGSASLNGKSGLVTASGRILLPFIYDVISPDRSWEKANNTIWEVEQEGLHGLYNIRQGWLVEPEYPFLDILQIYYTEPDSSIVVLFAGSKEQQCGASTTAGQVIIPWTFPYCAADRSGMLFYSADSVVRLDVGCLRLKNAVVRNQLSISPDSALPTYDHILNRNRIGGDMQFPLFAADNGSTIYYNKAHTHDSLYIYKKAIAGSPQPNPLSSVPDSISIGATFMVYGLTPSQRIGSSHLIFTDREVTSSSDRYTYGMFALHLKDTSIDLIYYRYTDSVHVYYQSQDEFVFRDDGKVLTEPGTWVNMRGVENEYTHEVLFTAKNPNHWFAIIDTAGNYAVGPIRAEVSYFSAKYMWVNARPGRSEFDLFFKPKWKLVRRSDGVTVSHRSDHLDGPNDLWNNMTTTTTDKYGVRLYNIDEQRYIPGNYNNIVAMNESNTAFLVRTCSGKIGVSNDSGTLVVDTIWNTMSPFEISGAHYILSESGLYRPNYYFAHYFAMSNDTGSVIFDCRLGHIVNDTVLNSYVVRNMRVFPDSLDRAEIRQNNDLNSYTVSSQILLLSSDSVKLKAWHKQILIDSLCATLRPYVDSRGYDRSNFIHQCDYCEQKTGQHYIRQPNTFGNDFFMQHVSDSILSYWAVADDNRMMWYTNIFLFPDGPRNMTLDSLFIPESNWKNFVINSVLNYVNNHLYITGDCHNPAAFPEMLNDRFLCTTEGIELYPEDFEEGVTDLIVLIPWNDAMPYLRADVKSKLPAK